MASRLKNMIRLLGWKDGLSFYRKARSGRFGEISASKWKTSFRLRPGTTDFDTYEHVFVLKEYDIPLKFEPRVIVDGGANIGMSAIYFATRYPQAKIISIEPDTKNYELLVHNTRDLPNVTTIQKGLWNESGYLRIVDPAAGANAFMVQKANNEEPGSLPAISLDDIAKEQDAQILDIVKLDIEGAEKAIFESNYEYWLPRTRLLVIELHDHMQPGASKAVFSAINKYDFSCETKWENLLFFNNALKS